MKCPACGNVLEAMTIGETTVDVCKKGCGGVWFDRFELQRMDEQAEPAGDLLLQTERDPSIVVDRQERRTCPHCNGVVMMRHYFSPKAEVQVDECPGCAGLWLDYGELVKIRQQYRTAEERGQAAEKHFEEIFGQALKERRKESREKHDRSRRLARMLRFLCPSYYVPGKQRWGAF